MDKTTTLGSSNTAVSSKKLPFSSAERELIVALVRERPIISVIEDKRTHAKNIELKKQDWEELTVAYNSQPYVSQRVTHQLKRCWENIKTQRKKELSQESITLKRTGGGPPESGSTISVNIIDTICPFINLRVPGVIDSNSIELLSDTKKPYYGKNQEAENENSTVTVIDLSMFDDQNEKQSKKRTIHALLENEPDEHIYLQSKRNKDTLSTPTSRNKFLSETDARIKRTMLNIQQDQALHELRLQREKILIARETNLLEHENNIHALQIQKIKLIVDLLTKQINKTS